jgi:phosphoglycolate phosphatase
MPLVRPCRLFLFDLDGTLIDSKADIALALNLALARMKLPALSMDRVSEFVGEGVQKLVQRSLLELTSASPDPGLIQSAAVSFQSEYEKHLLDSTHLIDGAREAIDRLHWASLAVVTNKPSRFARSILKGLGIEDRFCSIVGGDSASLRKPDPQPLLMAMACCGAAPSESVMVGDSAIDILAGKAAGVMTCGVVGGFRSREELEESGCDRIISSLMELPDLFCAV